MIALVVSLREDSNPVSLYVVHVHRNQLVLVVPVLLYGASVGEMNVPRILLLVIHVGTGFMLRDVTAREKTKVKHLVVNLRDKGIYRIWS